MGRAFRAPNIQGLFHSVRKREQPIVLKQAKNNNGFFAFSNKLAKLGPDEHPVETRLQERTILAG